MPDRRNRRHLACTARDAANAIARYWGANVGLALVCAYHSDEPWLSAKDLARDCGVSEDTASRRLVELETAGRVCSRMKGRTRVYCVTTRAANYTHDKLMEVVEAATCG